MNVQIPKELFDMLCDYFLDSEKSANYTSTEQQIALELLKKQNALSKRKQYMQNRVFYAKYQDKPQS